MESKEYERKRRMLYKVPFVVSMIVISLFFIIIFLNVYIAIILGTIVLIVGIYRSFINLPLSIIGLRAIRKNQNINFYQKIKGSYEKVFHIVLAPAYKEDNKEFYERLILSTKNSKIAGNIAVIFVLEEDDKPAHKIVENLMKKYENVFMVIHPPEDGVIRAKGPADTYAAKLIASIRYHRNFKIPKEASEYTKRVTRKLIYDLEPLIKNKEVVIHSIDIDMFYPHNYFEYFTYKYLSTKNRKNAVFENVIALVNNLNDVGTFSRNIAIFTTYTSVANNVFSIIHTTFASYALSLDLLDKVGYWRTDVIQDDSSIYWSIRTKLGRKKMRFVPLMMPIFGNAIKSKVSRTHEFYAQWKQLQRWGMGAADFADIWLSDAPLREKFSSIPWWVNNHIFWEVGGVIGVTSLLLSMLTGFLVLPAIIYMISYIITLIGMSISSKLLGEISYQEMNELLSDKKYQAHIEKMTTLRRIIYPVSPENSLLTPLTTPFASTAIFVIGEISKRSLLWIDLGFVAALNISSFCALHGAYKAFKYELKFFISPK